MDTPQQTAISLARADIGIHPDTHGVTKYSTDYRQGHALTWDNQPWCALAVTYWLRHAGADLPEMQAPGFRGFASANIGLDYCRSHGWIVETPQPGDLVFFDWNADGHFDHVGLVALYNPTVGNFLSIEGNTGPSPGIVAEHSHPMGKHLLFARLPPDIWEVCWLHNACPV